MADEKQRPAFAITDSIYGVRVLAMNKAFSKLLQDFIQQAHNHRQVPVEVWALRRALENQSKDRDKRRYHGRLRLDGAT